MGGGGGGSRSIGDVKSLIERAKEELRGGEETRRNVFISFDYGDITDVNMLRASAKNDKSPIEFNDWSVSEPIDSERAQYIKQKISDRISQSSLTVVYVSDKTPQSSWVAWEIEKSLELGKHVIGVYKGDTQPQNLPNAFTKNRLKAVPWAKLAETIDSLK
jgi:hypothetical protein